MPRLKQNRLVLSGGEGVCLTEGILMPNVTLRVHLLAGYSPENKPRVILGNFGFREAVKIMNVGSKRLSKI